LKHHVLAIAALVLAAAPVSLKSQVCAGRPSLPTAPVNLGVDASFTDGATGVGASLGLGNDAGFVIPTVGYVSYSDADASSMVVGATGGLSVKPATNSSLRVCPIAQVTYAYGPNEDTGIGRLTTNQLGAMGGLAIGGVAKVSPGFAVIPNAFGGVLHQRSTFKLGSDSETISDTGGAIGGGVSLLFNDIFAIVPSITVPVGFETSDPVFSIGVSIGFLRR
jgi:hypothetical protein